MGSWKGRHSEVGKRERGKDGRDRRSRCLLPHPVSKILITGGGTIEALRQTSRQNLTR